MIESNGKSIESVIDELGEITVSVSGISMYPMIRNRRDMVVIAKVDRELKKHDVPVYRLKSGKIVMHRIIKITKNGEYIIRGDNLMKKEYGITDDNIVGVLKSFYRGGKFYDCEKSIAYKVYVIFNRVSFPVRYLWRMGVRLPLGRIKRAIFKK